jgi:hypothetical protein
MITCHLMGGLGNQLFQIFTTISCAINTRQKFVFLNVDKLGGGQTIVRSTYWNTFLYKLKIFTTPNFPRVKLTTVKEKGFVYTPIHLLNHPIQDICLYGYFQSYKYFENNFQLICKMIDIEEIKKNVVLSANISQEYLNKTTSLHFRLGDYKKIQQYHPIMNVDYYKNAISCIQTKDPEIQNILYFCEEEDIEDVSKTIHALQHEFSDIIFIRASAEVSDWEQMILMSCCRHNIIANSSFSWWGAYFNTNPNKIVCYPSVWFGEAAGHNTIDLCPKEWDKIHIVL